MIHWEVVITDGGASLRKEESTVRYKARKKVLAETDCGQTSDDEVELTGVPLLYDDCATDRLGKWNHYV